MSNKYELTPLRDATGEASVESRRKSKEYSTGIDDGLTTTNEKPTAGREPSGRKPTEHKPTEHKPRTEPEPAYPQPSDPNNTTIRRPMDVNLYATKKTVAQGMMDLALLTANANQLRYVLESGNSGAYYYFSVTLISMSIVLQLVIGIALIFLGRYNVMDISHMSKAEKLNNFVVLGVFLITSVNVFISAFGIEPIERMDPALIVDATLESLKAKEPGETATVSY